MELLHTIKHYLFSPDGIKELITNWGQWGYLIVMVMVFCETGILIGLFFPGDSLLFVAGFLAGAGNLNFWALNAGLMFAAIAGDTVGYWIGNKTGPALFKRDDSLFFKKKYVYMTQLFYEKHGKKTIVLARFVPIVRTFAPVIAGVGQMRYRDFIAYNVIGGIGWVASMTAAGYFLGQFEVVQRNLEKVVILIIFVSVLPAIIEYFRHRKGGPAEGGAPSTGVGPEPSPEDLLAEEKRVEKVLE